ncbi:MAG: hypothetical protein OXR84_14200 [Magnetovibrio sp.]|nr:hypothetical protein [Magnetovibrio sp.]
MARRRAKFLVGLLIAAAVAAGAAARADGIDPHRLYEKRCARCHVPHGGRFVRDNLERRGGEIIGRASGDTVLELLEEGHGRLKPAEVPAMMAHLAAILDSGAVFQRHCVICHGRAVDLARRELIVRDGELYGRYSRRPVAIFLATHGRQETAETGILVRMLKRQLVTAE